jgi:hypothetical protein
VLANGQAITTDITNALSSTRSTAHK